MHTPRAFEWCARAIRLHAEAAACRSIEANRQHCAPTVILIHPAPWADIFIPHLMHTIAIEVSPRYTMLIVAPGTVADGLCPSAAGWGAEPRIRPPPNANKVTHRWQGILKPALDLAATGLPPVTSHSGPPPGQPSHFWAPCWHAAPPWALNLHPPPLLWPATTKLLCSDCTALGSRWWWSSSLPKPQIEFPISPASSLNQCPASLRYRLTGIRPTPPPSLPG
jgi:hypothetical protein